MKTLEDVEGYL